MKLEFTRHAKERFKERIPGVVGRERVAMTTKAWLSTEKSETLDYVRKQHRGQAYLWRDFHYRLYNNFIWVFERVRPLHKVVLITVFPHQSIMETQFERACKFYTLEQLY